MSYNNNNNNLDYISKLNLESINNYQFSTDSNDLASFTDSSFFDFDKFPVDGTHDDDLKLNYQQQFQQQIQDPEQFNDLLSFDGFKQEPTNDDDVFKQPSLPVQSSSLSTVTSPAQTIQQSPSSSPNTSLHSEVDKKKRNTAASARFRIKKKLKEQEMERTLKNLNEKVSLYNARIQKLEMENKCLKSLIIEKNEQKSNDLLKQIKERSIVRSD